MISKSNDKIRRRLKRKTHIRKTIHGTASKPRMSVFRSNKNIYVQVIDDDNGTTIAAASTMEQGFSSPKVNKETAGKIGEAIGKKLKEKNIETVVFDRNGYLYHGVIKSVADGARSTGIKF